MADVVNLGQFQRVPTLAENLSEALSEGIRDGSTLGNAVNKRRIADTNATYRAKKDARDEERLQMDKDKANREASAQELDMQKKGIDFAEKVQEMLSRRRQTLDDSAWGVWEQSDENKQLVKEVKKYAPMLIDEQTKNIKLLSNEDLLRKDFETAEEYINQKISRNIPLSPPEEQLRDVFHRENPAALATMLLSIQNSNEYLDNEDDEKIDEDTRNARRRDIIARQMNAWNVVRGGKSDMSQALDPNNPLGINLGN